jgi:hypothetical protein
MAKRQKNRQHNDQKTEEQTTQWPKEKVQKDEQRSTKHTHKTKDWVTRTQLKTGGELRCSERVGNSCSTSDTCKAIIDTIYQGGELRCSERVSNSCSTSDTCKTIIDTI